MRANINSFKGMIPVARPHLLPENAAQVAENCMFVRGSIRPLSLATLSATPTKTGTLKSLYRYIDNFWFSWTDDVDCIKAPIVGDTQELTIFTGDGVPKITDSAIATSGGTDYPENAYILGVPQPANSIILTVTGTAPSDIAEYVTKAYVYTYVNAYGQEGAPSDPSNVADVGPDQTAALTNMSVAPTGAYNITHKRIYIANTDSNGNSEYQYLATVTVGTTTYDDTEKDDFGETIVVSDYSVPPDDLAGIINHPGGFMVGFSGRDLCMSVVGGYHSWPVGYRLSMDYDIVSVQVFGTSILVMTEGTPYIVTGGDPSSMYKERLEVKQACVSKRGVVDFGDTIVYPSPHGLVSIGLEARSLITGKIIDYAKWQEYSPESILAVDYNGKYVAFYDNGTTQGGFIFDRFTGDFTEIDLYATAAFQDLKTGILFLIIDGEIDLWNPWELPSSGDSVEFGDDNEVYFGDVVATFSDPEAMEVTWRSKEFRTPRPVNIGAAQVLAEDYPVTFKIYGSHDLLGTIEVQNTRPFHLPGGIVNESHYFEIVSKVEVTEVSVAETMDELNLI